jgi:hypothetical protein
MKKLVSPIAFVLLALSLSGCFWYPHRYHGGYGGGGGYDHHGPGGPGGYGHP